jgi:hypothetical protein
MRHTIYAMAACLLAGCQQSPPGEVHAAAKVAAPAAAAAPTSAEIAASIAGLCKSESLFARSVMTSRQDGRPMSTAMELVAGPDPEVAAGMRKIVVEAYESPHYGSEALKNQETADFADQAYLQCVKKQPDL